MFHGETFLGRDKLYLTKINLENFILLIVQLTENAN